MIKQAIEFKLRRRVYVTARLFFDSQDFAQRRDLIAELLDAIVEYSADQKFVDPLSIAQAEAVLKRSL